MSESKLSERKVQQQRGCTQPMTPQAEAGIVTKPELSNPTYNISILNQLLHNITVTTGKIAPKQVAKLLISYKETGLMNPASLSIYYYFYVNKAATGRLIENELGFSQVTTYKIIRRLTKMGIISPISKVRGGSMGGGPKSVIYAVKDHTPDDIQNCIVKENKRTTKSYTLCLKITQLILDEYLDPTENEVSIKDIIKVAKKHNYRGGFHLPDMTQQVCNLLHERGVKVWR